MANGHIIQHHKRSHSKINKCVWFKEGYACDTVAWGRHLRKRITWETLLQTPGMYASQKNEKKKKKSAVERNIGHLRKPYVLKPQQKHAVEQTRTLLRIKHTRPHLVNSHAEVCIEGFLAKINNGHELGLGWLHRACQANCKLKQPNMLDNDQRKL